MVLSKEKVSVYLDKIRPQLQADGGDIELIKVTDDKIYVRLQGHCRGCAMSQYTIKMGIERYLKQQLGNEVEVISVD